MGTLKPSIICLAPVLLPVLPLSCPLYRSLSHRCQVVGTLKPSIICLAPVSPLSHSLSHPLSCSLSCPLSHSLSRPLSHSLSHRCQVVGTLKPSIICLTPCLAPCLTPCLAPVLLPVSPPVSPTVSQVSGGGDPKT